MYTIGSLVNWYSFYFLQIISIYTTDWMQHALLCMCVMYVFCIMYAIMVFMLLWWSIRSFVSGCVWEWMAHLTHPNSTRMYRCRTKTASDTFGPVDVRKLVRKPNQTRFVFPDIALQHMTVSVCVISRRAIRYVYYTQFLVRLLGGPVRCLPVCVEFRGIPRFYTGLRPHCTQTHNSHHFAHIRHWLDGRRILCVCVCAFRNAQNNHN